jgi:hypothetical protein
LKFAWLTATVGGLQLQGILTVFAGPVKLNVALAGQFVGTVILTVVDWPGDNTPFCGENVMPLTPLADPDQLKPPWALVSLLTVAVQLHVEFAPSVQSLFAVKLAGLADSCGATQFHVALTVLLGDVNVKVAWAGQFVFGMVIVTGVVWPEDRTPLAGEKPILSMPLLDVDQFKLGSPGLLELRDSVSVHAQPFALS